MVRPRAVWIRLAVAACCLSNLLTRPARAEEPAKRTEPVRIGLVRSLYRDTPEALVQVMMEPFSSLMEKQTGVAGRLVMAGEAYELAQHLKADKFQLGIFQGVEYAWVQQELPELKPLTIAINKRRHLQACLVARADSEVKTFDDLRQKSVALPRHSREHCHLFLARCCREQGQDAKHYFSLLATPAGVEPALDDVVRGKVQAAVVDAVGLESYKHEKPGCFERLKTIKLSEAFPAAVIVYYRGHLGAATLDKFKDGMARANDSGVGRQLLAAVRWTGFEPVPGDYQKTLTDILKVYPPPTPGERAVTAPAKTTATHQP